MESDWTEHRNVNFKRYSWGQFKSSVVANLLKELERRLNFGKIRPKRVEILRLNSNISSTELIGRKARIPGRVISSGSKQFTVENKANVWTRQRVSSLETNGSIDCGSSQAVEFYERIQEAEDGERQPRSSTADGNRQDSSGRSTRRSICNGVQLVLERSFP